MTNPQVYIAAIPTLQSDAMPVEQCARSREPLIAPPESTSSTESSCAVSHAGVHGRSGVRVGGGTGPRT